MSVTVLSQPAMANLKNLPYGGASAVVDPDMERTIQDIIHQAPTTKWLNDDHIHQRFLDQYRAWIVSSTHNHLTGLKNFGIACFSQGTTESFDKFYLRNHHRRFRCFRGEYMYHAASWRNYFPGWRYIEDEAITENDAVVVSMPFSDTGDVHPETIDILKKCTALGVPVLIDCAFFGICRGIEFDFDHDCITDVTFSLSKTFPVSHVRIGMRLTRIDDDDSLLVHHKTKYVNRFGAGLGLELIREWGSDHNSNQWGSLQADFCQELGITPSKSVIFGIAVDKFSEYNRGNATNRLCFAKYFAQGKLKHD